LERGEETISAKLARAAKRWLERTSRWLLVLDVVRDADQIDSFFPTEHRGHAIIVSRSRDWVGRGAVLNLLAFGREESVQLLLEAANSSDAEGARRLAERVGDQPLALALCAASIKQGDVSFKEFIGHLDAVEAGQLQEPTSVGAQIELAVAPLERESPAAALVLNLCAFLGEEEIPLDVLASAQPDRDVLGRALRTLERRGLATVSDSGVRIHGLLAQIIQQRLTPSERKRWIKMAVSLLQANLPRTDGAQSAASLPASLLTCKRRSNNRPQTAALPRKYYSGWRSDGAFL
jgi:hypothetical protein